MSYTDYGQLQFSIYFSHKQKKALWKKEKRKAKRQVLAQERDKEAIRGNEF